MEDLGSTNGMHLGSYQEAVHISWLPRGEREHAKHTPCIFLGPFPTHDHF